MSWWEEGIRVRTPVKSLLENLIGGRRISLGELLEYLDGFQFYGRHLNPTIWSPILKYL
ncbi:MAG: hypothetical protein QXX87_04155 [Candidatus Jordarchaeales archaeon]